MLLVLHELARHPTGPRLVGVAHLHHGIRGQQADEDQAFCQALAERLGLQFVTAGVDVPFEARRTRRSIEVAGRECRRQFLDQARQRLGADAVATAHTADDQAETVLLRLIRGTGLRGLAGIAPLTRDRIRPVLGCARADLRADLERRGEAWREDPTNLDLANPRNRIRHELIPYLQTHFNPRTTRALGRLADLARADNAVLEALTDAAGDHADPADGPEMPDGIARRLVARLLSDANPARTPTLAAVEMARDVAAGRAAAAQIPGYRVEPSARSVVLVHDAPRSSPPSPFEFVLSLPGSVGHPDQGWSVEAEGPKRHREGPEAVKRGGAGTEVVVDADELGASVVVRSRRAGDAIRPLGLGGRKKVQDVFVDRKVVRSERDRVPIVTDARGRIVWVAGHVLDERFRVTDRTNAVIVLKLRRV